MPTYEYTAIDGVGKKLKGSVEADNVRAARQKLRAKAIFTTDIKESLRTATEDKQDLKRYFRRTNASLAELSVATRQLATLLNAGLTLVTSLQAIAEQVDSPAVKGIFTSIREQVEQGSTLAKALGAFPKTFPKLYVNMVASGEASGTLDMVLENLADYLEGSQELKRKVSGALFYPILMLGFSLLVVIILVSFVVPKIVDIFVKQGASLPLPTQIMLAISNFLTTYWYILIGLIAVLIVAAQRYYAQPAGRAMVDRWALKVVLFGDLYTKINTARFARTLGTLLKNGVGLLNALDIVKNIVSNFHIITTIENTKEGVREGRSLAKELAKGQVFPSLVLQMISVGEASGRLETMLEKAAKSYENEVNAKIGALTTLIEPAMMIFLGILVFGIVISILLPMAGMINIIQKPT